MKICYEKGINADYMLPAPFLASQEIDPATFEANQLAAGSCPRYFRAVPGTTAEDVLLEFPEAKPVSWQPGFWAIARDSKLSCSRLAKCVSSAPTFSIFYYFNSSQISKDIWDGCCLRHSSASA